MSYQVIARKFRPQTFLDVLGQDHITKTLSRAIETGRIHHAFLFTGARGVGKTSTARILAKALNCETGPTTKPCGTCKACTEITQGKSLDVLEIDGASNTGVDDVRELRENIRYLPSSGKYRVFIIDEVHMLSTSAFNALLKTLEEPPAHVIFIFATTEPHKILETILSRCQRYDFRLLSQTKILEQLQTICDREKLPYEKEALFLLAEEAAGSMRDGETLLDQVLASLQGKLTQEAVTQGLGLIDRKVLREALQLIVERKAPELLQKIRHVHEFGFDIRNFTQKLLYGLRHLAVIKSCGENMNTLRDLVDLPEEEIHEMLTWVKQATLADLERLYHLLAGEFFHITHAANQRIALDMALLRVVQTPPLEDIAKLLEEVKALREHGVVNQPKAPPPPVAKMEHKPAPVAHPVKTAPPAKSATPATSSNVSGTALWEQMLEILKKKNQKLVSFLRESSPMECTAEHLTIGIAANPFYQEMTQDHEIRTLLCETMKTLTAKMPTLTFRTVSDTKPIQTESQERREVKQKLNEEVRNLPLVKDFQKVFGAEIEEVKNLEQGD